MKNLSRYALLGDLDEALIAESLPPSWGGTMSAAVIAESAAAEAEATATTRAAAGFVIDEPVTPRGFRRVLSFLRSGWGIGLIASAVAVGVAVAALMNGWGSSSEPGMSETDSMADSRYETTGDTAPGSGTPQETDTADPGEMEWPNDAKIVVCNGAGDRILPDMYSTWTTVWMPGEDGAPGSFASGDSAYVPAMEDLIATSKMESIQWDLGMRFVTAENYSVTSLRLYNTDGEFRYVMDADDVVRLDTRTGGGVFYVRLGLVYTGQFIEEADDHEKSGYDVMFRLVIGEDVAEGGSEAATEPETETPPEGPQYTSHGDGTCELSVYYAYTPTDVVIPEFSPDGDRVTSIGDYVFGYCDMIRSVTLPDTVTSIGYQAFAECPNLTTVSLGNGLETIKGRAFAESDMEELIIPSSLKVIGEDAFKNTPIDRLVIQDFKAWFDIEFGSFGSSNPMNRASAIYIDGEPVEHMVIPEGVTIIKEGSLYVCAGVKSVTFPDSVTSIEGNLFCFTKDLTDVTLGSGIRYINDSAFVTCVTLERVYISDLAGWVSLESTDSSLGAILGSGLTYHVGGVLAEDLVIPEGVTFIQKGAFYDWRTLRSITIPDGVLSVGENAFGNCVNLESITLPDSVTEMGQRVLTSCVKLKSVALPRQLKEVPFFAFYDCTNLETVFIPAGVTRIGSYAFENCKSLKIVEFGGTMAQWEALYKMEFWDQYTPYFTVRCIDGDIQAGDGTYS